MTSGTGGGRDDDEDRWLLARERGEPAPPIAETTAATYAELDALMGALPAVPSGAKLRPGWQLAVLDAIDRGEAPTPVAPTEQVASIPAAPVQRSRRKRTAMVFSGLALAAALAIVLIVPPASGPELTISARSTDGTTRGGQRGAQLKAGGKASVHGMLEGQGELRVYDADDVELARCTVTGADCIVVRSGKRADLRLEISLHAAGPLHVLLLSAPLGGLSGGRAHDLEAARRAGIKVVLDLEEVVR